MRVSDASQRMVILSPHMDDAVWSCGGYIAQLSKNGHRVVIVSCFTADPDADTERLFLPSRWRAFLPARRREEEHAAAAELCAEFETLGLLDGAYRVTNGSPRYPDSASLFGMPTPDDTDVLEHLAALLTAWLRPGDCVHVPLAGGDTHVDHLLVRHAAQRAYPPARLYYYDEFPYSVGVTTPLALEPMILPVPLEPWLRAASKYRSQVMSLFGSMQRFQHALTAWAQARGSIVAHSAGQRLWVPSASR